MRPVWTFSVFFVPKLQPFSWEVFFFRRWGERRQMRCRLILLISEHPIQQGIRKGGVCIFGHGDDEERTEWRILGSWIKRIIWHLVEEKRKLLFKSFKFWYSLHTIMWWSNQKFNLGHQEWSDISKEESFEEPAWRSETDIMKQKRKKIINVYDWLDSLMYCMTL